MKFNKNSIVFAIIVFVAVVGFWGASMILKESKNDELKELKEETVSEYTETFTEADKMEVYITGEVKNPGVYEIEENYRVDDVVKKAGGLTEKADVNNINLAAYVKNEEHIFIKSIDDSIDKNENSIQNNSEDNNVININTADKDELKKLNGIGEAIASNIISYREENGNFKSVDELKNVSRIGDKLFEKIKKYIKV